MPGITKRVALVASELPNGANVGTPIFIVGLGRRERESLFAGGGNAGEVPCSVIANGKRALCVGTLALRQHLRTDGTFVNAALAEALGLAEGDSMTVSGVTEAEVAGMRRAAEATMMANAPWPGPVEVN